MARAFPSNPTPAAIQAASKWLSQFDFKNAGLECDGMTRVISTALVAQDVEHSIIIGRLTNPKDGGTILHYWIKLNEKYIIDLAAKLWFPHVAQNGLFIPKEGELQYEAREELPDLASDFIFNILTNRTVADFESLSETAFEAEPTPAMAGRGQYRDDEIGPRF